MAKIVPSDNAPSETVHYTFAGAEFDLGGSGKGSKRAYESTDPTILSNAEAHPWLAVERPEVQPVSGAYVEQIAPEDDPLSAVNDNANDPEAVKATEDAKLTDSGGSPTAVDAGLDQDKVVETGGVAETIAADHANTDEDNS